MVSEEKKAMGKFKIVSDGTLPGTYLLDQESGKVIPCQSIKWEAGIAGGTLREASLLARATVVLTPVAAELTNVEVNEAESES